MALLSVRQNFLKVRLGVLHLPSLLYNICCFILPQVFGEKATVVLCEQFWLWLQSMFHD
jgi:hypothetical protein